MIEAMVAATIEPLTSYFTSGRPVPVFDRAASSQAYNVTCRDGKRIGLHTSILDKFFFALCRAVDRPDWIDVYPTRKHRIKGYEQLALQLDAIFRTRDRADWIAGLDAADVPFGPENELQDLELFLLAFVGPV